MATTKNLLLATAFAMIVSLPAFANDAPASGVGAASDAAVVPGAPSLTGNTGAGPSNTLPVENINDPVVPEPATPVIDPVVPPATIAPAPVETPVAPPADVPAETPAVPADDQSAADPVTPATPEPAQATVVEEPAKPAEPEKPKVTPPAKLSALAKKYKLLDLDTDGNKSLSKQEFTANGFANAKVFNRYDFDGNGKLTNGEINAYAKNIEANINK